MIYNDAFPEDWEFTRAVLLHKGGEKNNKRFRIIVVDWVGRKLLEKIICNRVDAIIEKKHIKYQFGCIKNLSCGHMVHVMRLISTTK
eukprot:8239275-Heterocapsa_arctica.AAC.1